MNGWEFLKEYNQLDKVLQSRAIIIMLTTSDNADDVAKANTYSFVSDYITKPLTKEIMRILLLNISISNGIQKPMLQYNSYSTNKLCPKA